MTKVAVVLSGGGSKGAFEIGVLDQLIAKGLKPDVIYGTSVGAVNAAGVSYLGVAETIKLWESLKSRGDVLAFNWGILWSDGFYTMKPLRQKLEANMKGKMPTCEAVACYVNLENGAIHYESSFNNDALTFAKMVEASSALPLFMCPVDGKYVDGGIREQVPLRMAIEQGADKIIVVLTEPLVQNPIGQWKSKASWPYILHVGVRSLGLMVHEIFLNDLKNCAKKNDEPGYKKIELEVYAPSQDLHDSLDYSQKSISAAIELGRKAGAVWL
jgi:NTE family protein